MAHSFHAVHLIRTLYAYDLFRSDKPKDELTAGDLERGAKQVAKALWGTHTTPTGMKRPVSGDVTKVSRVPELALAAQRLFTNHGTCNSQITWHARVSWNYALRHTITSNSVRHAYAVCDMFAR